MPVHFQIGVAYSYSPWYSTGTQFEMNSALMSVPTLTLHDLNTASQLPAFQYPQYGFLPRIYPYFHPPMSLNPPGSFDEMNPQCLPVTSLPPIIDRSDDELQIRMNPLVREPMNTIPLTSIPFRK